MRAVVQRVARASVTIAGELRARIGPGLLILVAVEDPDTGDDAEWLAGKLVRLRLFPDERGERNRTVAEAGGGGLGRTEFSLSARTWEGNRPSFMRAARPEGAIPRYKEFLALLEGALGRPVARGEFGADMQVELVNDGPVTLILDTRDPE